MKTIIEMAREAGFDAESDTLCRYEGWVKPLMRFADLVVAAEREAFAKIQFESILQAIRIEREACAKLCDDLDDDLPDGLAGWQYGEAIRARGNK